MIPMHERKILEAHVRGVSLSQLPFEQEPLNEFQETQLKDLIKLRMRKIPLQYLVGSQNFYGRDFYVNTSVLVPRPETEQLVELVLKQLGTTEKYFGLDVGTGSGCIALTIALERPNVQMMATESQSDALEIALENCKNLNVKNINFTEVRYEPDLSQYHQFCDLDFIVSNPPYLIETDEVSEDVRTHEPLEALFVPSDDALKYYKFLLELMKIRLKDSGFAAFEIAENRSNETKQLFEQAGYSAEVMKDLAGRDRILFIKKEIR